MKHGAKKQAKNFRSSNKNVSALVEKVIKGIHNLEEGDFLHLDGGFSDEESSDDVDFYSQFNIDIQPIKIENYQLKKKISENPYEIELIITDKQTNDIFFAVMLNNSLRKVTEKEINDFSHQIKINTKLKSPLILKFIGYNLNDITSKPNPTLIFEYPSNGTLTTIIESDKKSTVSPKWNDTKKFIVIYGIASCMSYLHSLNIVHQDLNPANVYLTNDFFPKVGNFKSSSEIENEPIEKQNSLKSGDVYSFSLIVYEMITLEKPPNPFKLTKSAKNVPKSYLNLIECCTSAEEKIRPTFDEICYKLKTDKNLVGEKVDEDEFMSFLEAIGETESLIFGKADRVHLNLGKQVKSDTKKLTIKLKELNLSQFEKNAKIEDGTFCKVYKVIEKQTGLACAAKIALNDLSAMTDVQISNFTNEVNLLSKLNSPLMVKFIGYSSCNFKSKPKPMIFTELARNGSLESVLKLERNGLTCPEWNDTKKLIVIYGIALGMSYLHSLNVLHRNLQPSNILLDDFLFPKICDFTLSIDLKTQKITKNSMLIGTPAYMAPEILTDEKYSQAADVYAFALIVYEIVTHEVPFQGLNEIQLIKTVLSGNRPEIKPSVPDCYRVLIESCWCQNPQQRPSFNDIVESIRANKDFITKMVNQDEFHCFIGHIEDKMNQTDGKNKRATSKQFRKVSIDSKLFEKVDSIETIEKVDFLYLSLFEKHSLVSQDSCYKTYQVKSKETGVCCSATCFRVQIEKLNQDEILNLKSEVTITSRLNHPSFLKLFGCCPFDFHGKRRPVIVSELASNGRLSSLLESERKGRHFSEFNETKKLIIIYGIAAGMAYLHSCGILHRNLNPGSIYLDNCLFPKIGDFCFTSLKKKMLESMIFQPTEGSRVDQFYSSPEVLNSKDYSKSSEVYSFSLIVYEILTNEIPFENVKNLNSLFEEVVKKSNRPKIKIQMPSCYKNLIEICWQENPDERPTFEDITHILKTDNGFITEKVDKDFFMKYVQFIEKSKNRFYSQENKAKLSDFIKKKSHENDAVKLQKQKSAFSKKKIKLNDARRNECIFNQKYS